MDNNGKPFSGKVKSELLKKTDAARGCRLAELAALVSCAGSARVDAQRGVLNIRADNIAAAQKIKRLIKLDFRIFCEVGVIRRTPRKRSAFTLTVRGAGAVAKIINGAGLTVGQNGNIEKTVPEPAAANERRAMAYLRGLFICCGSVSEPSRRNHLEFAIGNAGFTAETAALFEKLKLGFKPGITVRKSKALIYFKDGERICDVLSALGAGVSMMEYENSRIIKEINNGINRRVNFENANMDKTINAAVRQINEILLIEKTIGLASLPDNIAQVAKARLQNPEISMTEIGLLINPPVGKSGVNHRFKKLGEIAGGLHAPNGSAGRR